MHLKKDIQKTDISFNKHDNRRGIKKMNKEVVELVAINVAESVKPRNTNCSY